MGAVKTYGLHCGSRLVWTIFDRVYAFAYGFSIRVHVFVDDIMCTLLFCSLFYVFCYTI